MEKKYLFKDKNESYKHYYAKFILRNWLIKYFIAIRIEEKITMPYEVRISDLSCYSIDGISTYYEVVHTSFLSHEKIDFYKRYMIYLDHQFKVLQIQSEWILKQVKEPKKLICERIL